MLERYRPRKIFVKPAFLYTLLNIRIPSYVVNTPAINLELAEYPRNTTLVTQCKQEFLRLWAMTYGYFQELYTDGSKREAGVGAAVVGLGRVRKATLLREASILSSEIHAIEMAMKIIAEVNGIEFVVFSDSYNALKCIEDAETQHPIARNIIHDIDRLQRETRKLVHMCWIPSYRPTGVENLAGAGAGVAKIEMPGPRPEPGLTLVFNFLINISI